MDRENALMHIHTYTHAHLLLEHKKEISPFETPCLDLEGIMLTKLSQTGKGKNSMFSHMWKQKKPVIEIEIRMVVAKGWGKCWPRRTNFQI